MCARQVDAPRLLLFAQCGEIPDDLLDGWLCRFPAYRREVVLRYRFRADRLRSVAAFVLLCAGLGFIPDNMKTGSHGKPFLPGDGRRFNISHSAHMVAAGFSAGEIGVDVEALPAQYEDIMPRVFTRAEIADIQASPDPRRAFCALWTLKESYIKALGLGLSFSPRDVEFTVRPDAVLCSDDRFVFSRFSLDGGELAVCADAPCKPETLDLPTLCALWEGLSPKH